MMRARNEIPELFELEQLINQHKDVLRSERLTTLNSHGYAMPIYGISMGSTDPKAPVFGLFGGVHGLERIGTHVLLSYLKTLLYRMTWEKDWQEFFKTCRLVSIPIINPIGMAMARRGNGNNIDLMRNSPLEANGKMLPLLSGHRYGSHLPWYRGKLGDPVEAELQTVADFCKREFFKSQKVITLDLHSGFGLKDRLWYPWSTQKFPFPHENDVLRLKNLFENTHPYHIYIIEHQSLNYSNHGDLWDWIYIDYMKENPKGCFLPLTLEMGSWMWVKKNIWQVFSIEGFFNPVKKHRYARTMRRHQQLLEFLLKASTYHEAWSA